MCACTCDFSAAVIAVKCSSLPYIDAVLPKDQDLDAQELEVHQVTRAASQDMASSSHPPPSASHAQSAHAGDGAQSLDSLDSDAIDNPYLRAVRMPKKRRK